MRVGPFWQGVVVHDANLVMSEYVMSEDKQKHLKLIPGIISSIKMYWATTTG